MDRSSNVYLGRLCEENEEKKLEIPVAIKSFKNMDGVDEVSKEITIVA